MTKSAGSSRPRSAASMPLGKNPPECRPPKKLLEGGLSRRRAFGHKSQLQVLDDPIDDCMVREEGDDAHRAAASRTDHRVEEGGHVPNSREFGTCPQSIQAAQPLEGTRRSSSSTMRRGAAARIALRTLPRWALAMPGTIQSRHGERRVPAIGPTSGLRPDLLDKTLRTRAGHQESRRRSATGVDARPERTEQEKLESIRPY